MIYFVTARDIGRVKIGYSANPRNRLVGLQTGCPVRLVMERVMHGYEVDEADLHSRFAPHRLNGEWFSLAAEIEALMANLPAPEWSKAVDTPDADGACGPLAKAFVERMNAVAAMRSIAPSTLSAQVLGSGVLLKRMTEGKTITLAKFEKACAMLDELEQAQ